MSKISIGDDFLAPNAFWNSKKYLIKRKILKRKDYSKGQDKLAGKKAIIHEGFFCKLK